MQNNEKFEFLDKILSKNIGWINSADTKAGFVFLVSTSMTGVLAAVLPDFGSMTCMSLALTALVFALLAISILFLFFVNFPQLDGSNNSLIFFGGIIELKLNKYSEKILDGITQEILEDMAKQCYRTAEIANYKFKHLKTSFRLLFLALLPWIGTIILFYQFKAVT